MTSIASGLDTVAARALIHHQFQFADTLPHLRQASSYSYSNLTNYCLISLLSPQSKVKENTYVICYANALEITIQLQLSNGDLHQPLVTTGTKPLSKGKMYVWCFFDFSKAFDTVLHHPLLEKFQKFHVHSHFTLRKQYVCVDGVSSNILSVSSGYLRHLS